MVSAGGGFNLFGRHRVQGVLVVVQIAMAMMLLVGGGLLLRSLVNLSKADPGYDTTSVLTFQLSLARKQQPSSLLLNPSDVPRLLADYDRAAERIAAIPNVMQSATHSFCQ